MQWCWLLLSVYFEYFELTSIIDRGLNIIVSARNFYADDVIHNIFEADSRIIPVAIYTSLRLSPPRRRRHRTTLLLPDKLCMYCIAFLTQP
jgi:hypothetical protein